MSEEQPSPTECPVAQTEEQPSPSKCPAASPEQQPTPTECPVTTPEEPRCPMTSNVEQPKALQTDELSLEDAKAVPYQWWKFGLYNMVQWMRQGWPYFQQTLRHHNSTVFAVKLDEWTTFACDHKSIGSVFDLEKTARDPTGHGFLKFRPNMLEGHIPCLHSNGDAHVKAKAFVMRFIKDSYGDTSTGKLVDVVRKEFEKMKSLDFGSVGEAKKFDVELMFRDAAHNVASAMLLDTYWEDPGKVAEWTATCFRPTGIFGSPGDPAALAEQVYEMFGGVEKMKDLSGKYADSGLTEREMFNEVMFIVCGNASPGLSIFTTNSLLCYLRLSEDDKQLLKQEADQLFTAAADAATTSIQMVLHSLPYLHAFFMEMLRINSIPVVYGRAKKDFVMESTSGNFAIKKGDNLCGMPWMANRDESIFENATTFDMHRGMTRNEETEKYNFGYGGYFLRKAGGGDHKCGGVRFSMDAVKMFILMFTQCTFEATAETVYTGKNIFRKFGSDQPLSLMRFNYNGGS